MELTKQQKQAITAACPNYKILHKDKNHVQVENQNSTLIVDISGCATLYKNGKRKDFDLW